MASNTERNPQWLPNSFHCWIDPRGPRPRLERQGRRLRIGKMLAKAAYVYRDGPCSARAKQRSVEQASDSNRAERSHCRAMATQSTYPVILHTDTMRSRRPCRSRRGRGARQRGWGLQHCAHCRCTRSRQRGWGPPRGSAPIAFHEDFHGPNLGSDEALSAWVLALLLAWRPCRPCLVLRGARTNGEVSV